MRINAKCQKKAKAMLNLPTLLNQLNLFTFSSCCSFYRTRISFIRIDVYVGKIFVLGVIAGQSAL